MRRRRRGRPRSPAAPRTVASGSAAMNPPFGMCRSSRRNFRSGSHPPGFCPARSAAAGTSLTTDDENRCARTSHAASSASSPVGAVSLDVSRSSIQPAVKATCEFVSPPVSGDTATGRADRADPTSLRRSIQVRRVGLPAGRVCAPHPQPHSHRLPSDRDIDEPTRPVAAVHRAGHGCGAGGASRWVFSERTRRR